MKISSVIAEIAAKQPPRAASTAIATLPKPPVWQTVAHQLIKDATGFDFFQAVRLLERMSPEAPPLGHDGPVTEEAVRLRGHISLNFPPSPIYNVRAADEANAQPSMFVTFFGLAGCNGVMPRTYTDMLMRLSKETKHAERDALREWMDLFNHRLLSLFYRSWTKYRFFIAYERLEWSNEIPDPFTHGLMSLVGIGVPALRNRLQVRGRGAELAKAPPLAKINDLALLHYAGLFAQRPRTAANLEAILADYFQSPVVVQQFQGEWLPLETGVQSQLGTHPENCRLGESVVVGERVWSVEGKIRVRIGPLNYPQFANFMPDQSSVAERKTFLLLCQLTRLFIGPTLNFDVQLVLRGEAVPGCQLSSDEVRGPRLGWNTWVFNQPLKGVVEDAVFAGEEVFRL